MSSAEAAEAARAAHASFVNLFGGSLAGNVLTAVIFGVLTIQTVKYYQTFPGDSWGTKLSVGLLWIFQCFQLCCFSSALYWYLISNFGDPAVLGRANWEFASYQVITTAASVTAQSFFARRVYQLSKSLPLSILVETLVLLQFALGFATSAKANLILDFAQFVDEYTWLVVTWLASEALADVVITVTMCWLLLRKRTGFQRTDTMINKLVLYAINTGLFTSFVAIVILGVFASHGFHFVVLLLGVPFGGLYSITMLANLHTRSELGKNTSTTTENLSGIALSTFRAKRSNSKVKTIVIGQNTITESFADTQRTDREADKYEWTTTYITTTDFKRPQAV